MTGEVNIQGKARVNSEARNGAAHGAEHLELPRTISPIGIFFGSGAPHPWDVSNDTDSQGTEDDQGERAARAALRADRTKRAPIGTKRTRPLISMGVTVACGVFQMLVFHVPLDPDRPVFWGFLAWLVFVFVVVMLFLRGATDRG